MSTERKFGGIEFSGKDIGIPEVPFDKLAVSGRGELLLLSVFCDTMRVKQIRAILCGGAKAVATANGVKVNQAGADPWRAHTPGRLTPTPDGYQVFTHKLGFGMAHALFVTRMPGFLKVVTEESLWQELKSTRFTTPILREWMPWVEKLLRSEDLLEDAHTFNCRCGVLSATTKRLDDTVSSGLRERHIFIPLPADSGDVKVGDEIIGLEDQIQLQAPIQPPTATRSYRVAARVKGEVKPCYNQCRYRTRAEADAAASDLYSRWTMMDGWEVEECDDSPNQASAA